MVVTPGQIHLNHGPKENGFRPAVDPLFRSAARAYRNRAIGVVLSGGLADGAAGLRAIARQGGVAIVQDPNEAPFQSMPESALELGPVDLTLKAADIGKALVRLSSTMPEKAAVELEPEPAVASTYTCPECHGILWEIDPGSLEYRCRVGHSFSLASLTDARDDEVERAIWAAVRSLEEGASMSRRISEHMPGPRQYKRDLLARADEKERQAEVLRRILLASGVVKRTNGRKVKKRAKSQTGRP